MEEEAKQARRIKAMMIKKEAAKMNMNWQEAARAKPTKMMMEN